MDFLQNSTLWVAMSFAVFAAVAWRFGRAGFLAMLDSRIAEIRKEIQTAEGLRVEAQEMLAQYQRKQRDAMKEADALIEAARESAARIRLQAEAELEDLMTRREQVLAERLKRMEETAIQEIRAHAADLAIKASMQVIADQMDAKTNARLVEDSIRALPGQLN